MNRLKQTIIWRNFFNGYKKFYTSILISFILILIIPVLILGTILYSSLSNNAAQDFYKTHEKLVTEITSYIWQTTNNIETDLATLKTDTAFRNYRKIVNGEVVTSVSDYQHITNNLLSISSKYSVISSIYFYDKDFNTIYNTAYGSKSLEDFQDTDWLTQITNIARVQRLKPRPNMNNSYYEQIKDYSFKPYKLQSVLSLVSHANTAKTFVANISISSLYYELISLYSLNQDGSIFYFVDNDNSIVYTSDSEQVNTNLPVDLNLQELDSFSFKDKVYFSTPFYDNLLSCVISYPIDLMNITTNYFAEYIILLCAGLFTFLVFLANIVAKKLYQPINDLVNNIKNTPSLSTDSNVRIQDEIFVLKETFHMLDTKNSSMRYILSSYETIVRHHNIKLYLEGSLSYEDLVDEKSLPYLNINNTFYNQLILFRLPSKFLVSKSVHEMSLLRNRIKDVINTYIENVVDGFFLDLNHDTFIAFICINNLTALRKLKQVLYSTMDELLGQQIFLVESNFIYTKEDLLPNYQECNVAIKYAVFFNKIDAVVTISEINQEYIYVYDFLVNSEAGLIRYILLYNKDECMNIINEVSNNIKRTPNVSYAIYIWTQILSVLCKNMYLDDILNKHVIADFNQLNTLIDIEEFFSELCDKTIQYYLEHIQSESQYCTDAKKYIEDNYTKDFSISEVADYLNISYQYLSKIFKVDCGNSMSDYLNAIRIEKGKEYLCNTNDSFAVIAQKIGYNNVQSFQRFFKKFENITPSDYRKMYTIR